ncbi:MAG: type II toxin-antitoxin system RelE/ParE family toxin [Candidatus Babeliales bacterium]
MSKIDIDLINYKVILLNTLRKSLFKLPKKDQSKILEKLESLENNEQDLLDIKKLKNFKTLYKIRSGDYRIIYNKNDNKKEFVVTLICHRKEVYKLLANLESAIS